MTSRDTISPQARRARRDRLRVRPGSGGSTRIPARPVCGRAEWVPRSLRRSVLPPRRRAPVCAQSSGASVGKGARKAHGLHVQGVVELVRHGFALKQAPQIPQTFLFLLKFGVQTFKSSRFHHKDLRMTDSEPVRRTDRATGIAAPPGFDQTLADRRGKNDDTPAKRTTLSRMPRAGKHQESLYHASREKTSRRDDVFMKI